MDNWSGIPPVNVEPLKYWAERRYTRRQVDEYCGSIDDKVMAARVTLFGDREPEVRITSRTYKTREGHFPVIARTMIEMCEDPLLRGVTGSFIVRLEDGVYEWEREEPKGIPIFSFGRHLKDTHTLLIPDPSFLGSRRYTSEIQEIVQREVEFPWETKIPTIFWRGTATGVGMDTPEWFTTARGRMTVLSKELADPSLLDACFTKVEHLEKEQQDRIREKTNMVAYSPFIEFLKYRYLINADGYHCAWISLFLKLATRSVVLKMEGIYEQWYYWDLLPWKHYVPLSADLSDLLDVYEWLRTHDAEAREIVENANMLVANTSYSQSLRDMALSVRTLLSVQDD